MKYGYNSGGRWSVSDGKKPSREFAVWHSLMGRCYNPKHKAYPNYGGKGITVCEEWHDFQVFAQ